VLRGRPFWFDIWGVFTQLWTNVLAGRIL